MKGMTAPFPGALLKKKNHRLSQVAGGPAVCNYPWVWKAL